MIKNNARDTAYHLIAGSFAQPAIIWFQSKIKIADAWLGEAYVGDIMVTPEIACQYGHDDEVLDWAEKLCQDHKFEDAGLNC